MPTTTIQRTEAIRKGSVRVLIGDNFSSLVDIGALRNPVFNSLVENQSIDFDNVDSLKKFVNGKKANITFDLAEINLTNLAKLDAGLVNLTTVAGSAVSGAEQVVPAGAWAYDRVIELSGQNDNGNAPTINSVTGGSDGALTLNTDYKVVKLANGNWGISVIDSTGVTTEAQSITVDTDYIPSASKKITFVDSGNKVLKVIRLVNTDEFGKEFRIDIEKATNFVNYAMDFAGDDEEDVAIIPIQCEGNIVEIVDEQQTS